MHDQPIRGHRDTGSSQSNHAQDLHDQGVVLIHVLTIYPTHLRLLELVREITAGPYDLRHSFVSLLIHEGRSVVDVARQAGHSPTMTLDVYAHVFDEFDIAERVSAEDQIEQARCNESESCSPDPDDGVEGKEIPANP